MTRTEWKAAYGKLRRTVCLSRSSFMPGVSVGGQRGGFWFTRLHAAGHLASGAAHACVLGHASASRRIPADHQHFMAKAKALRQRGTWLAA